MILKVAARRSCVTSPFSSWKRRPPFIPELTAKVVLRVERAWVRMRESPARGYRASLTIQPRAAKRRYTRS